MKKEKGKYLYSLLLSLSIILILSLYVFDKLFSPAGEKEEKVDQTQIEKEIEDELIGIVKGYSAAVDKVVFQKRILTANLFTIKILLRSKQSLFIIWMKML